MSPPIEHKGEEANEPDVMKLSGAERIIIGARMFDEFREQIIASFPKDLTDEELKRRLFERTYGETLEQFLTRAEIDQ